MADEGENTKKGGEAGFLRTLGRDFFLGCVALLPLALFVFVFYYLIYLCEMFGALIFGFTQSRRSTALIIVFLVCLLVYIGRKLRRRERSLLSLLEQLVITKIPVIGGWYATFRDILQTFTASGGSSYLGTVKILSRHPAREGLHADNFARSKILGNCVKRRGNSKIPCIIAEGNR